MQECGLIAKTAGYLPVWLMTLETQTVSDPLQSGDETKTTHHQPPEE